MPSRQTLKNTCGALAASWLLCLGTPARSRTVERKIVSSQAG
jgi:hypothetical protein